MTIALTNVRAYGIECETALTKRYVQYLLLTVTAANTDTDIDLGDFTAGGLGNFWDAVDGTEPGDIGITTCRDIQARAQTFLGISSTELADYAKIFGNSVFAAGEFTTAGGDTDETITIANLLATDIVFVNVHTAGSTPYVVVDAAAAAGQINVDLSGDPSTDHILSYVVIRPTAAAVAAGQYALAMDGTETHFPNLTFATTDAPTATTYVLSWFLDPAEEPIEIDADANS